MAFGILEVRNGSGPVPGTSQLEIIELDRATVPPDNIDVNTVRASPAAAAAAAAATVDDKDPEIVLVPQPSSDCNDPLNWPLWQRDLNLLLLSYCTNLCVGG